MCEKRPLMIENKFYVDTLDKAFANYLLKNLFSIMSWAAEKREAQLMIPLFSKEVLFGRLPHSVKNFDNSWIFSERKGNWHSMEMKYPGLKRCLGL